MSGALGFTGGSSAITTGTNPCAGIGQRKRLDGAHACSARQWRTFSSGDQTSNALRDRLWCLVERTPNLDWLLLTKRPELARRLTPWRAAWPSNVWLGTTVENQHFADQRIRHLLCVPCRYRFLSCEPLLGFVDLSRYLDALHWVIAGGESGARARPTHPDWIRRLRDQCSGAGVAFHFKQWGNWHPREAYRNGDMGPITSFVRMSKKRAGRVLDGRTWDELPHWFSERPIRRSSAEEAQVASTQGTALD